MPQLHQRGVDLLVNVMDAASHVEKLTEQDVKDILLEVAKVLADLLERDIPPDRRK